MQITHLLGLVGLSAMALSGGKAHAQKSNDFPIKPIEVIVPYAAGGGVANMARAFAVEAAQEMGQQLVVVNKEGAGGVVGFNSLARAKPDGYTIAFSPASPLTNAPFVNSSMPYKLDQFEPVCQIFENIFAVVVKPNSPIRSFEDLVAKAKAAPGTLSFGHAGPASVGHLSLAAIERSSGIKFNAIAYRGDSQAMSDTLAGTLAFAALGVGTLSGKNMRALAVLSQKRHPALPDVPSVSEFGFPTNSQGLNGLFVPAGTPQAIIDRYSAVCKKIASSPSYIERARGMSQVVNYVDARNFKALIERTYRAHEALLPGLGLEKN